MSFPALALLQANPSGGNPIGLFFQNFGFLIIIFAIFYFLLIRPARTKQKRHQAMLSDLHSGDQVVTAGGLFGTVVGISDRRVTLRISDKVKVEFQRSSISEKLESEQK